MAGPCHLCHGHGGHPIQSTPHTRTFLHAQPRFHRLLYLSRVQKSPPQTLISQLRVECYVVHPVATITLKMAMTTKIHLRSSHLPPQPKHPQSITQTQPPRAKTPLKLHIARNPLMPYFGHIRPIHRPARPRRTIHPVIEIRSRSVAWLVKVRFLDAEPRN